MKTPLNCILTQNMDKSEEDTIDKKLDYLTRVMCETAEQINVIDSITSSFAMM
jgi:low affinity Fe/Cu permease